MNLLLTRLSPVLLFITIALSGGAQSRFDADKWEQAREGLNYYHQKPAQSGEMYQETEGQPGGKQPDGEDYVEESGSAVIPLGGLGQTLAYILFIALLILILYFIIRLFGGQNPSLKQETQPIELEDLEKRIMETDLEKLFKNSLAEKDFLQCIRLLYLMIVKGLSEKRLIAWRKYKTNRDYLYELEEEKHRRPFQHLTSLYEWAWYGNASVDEQAFQELEKRFTSFKNQILKGE